MRIPIGYLKLSPSYPIFDFRRRDDRPRAKKRRRIERRGMRRTARGRLQPSANPGAGRNQTERSRRRLLASYLFFLVIISELPFLSVHNLSGDTPCYNRGMDVIVCHISALHYWLSHIGSPRIDALQSALAPQLGIPLRESEIAAAVSILPKERQREKVHLLTKTHEAARHSHDIAVHTTSLELTPADFHLAAPGVFVCSPEFALIQSAPSLSEIEFLRIAFAL